MRRGIAISAAVLLAVLVAPGAAATQSDRDDVEFVALSYNVAGLPEPLSGSSPATNSPLISPRLNDYDLVLLQEDWDDPIDLGDTALLSYHDLVVGDADHPHRSEPAPAPIGTDLERFPSGPPLLADGLNRLSRFPFEVVTRVMWRQCFGELTVTAIEEILAAAGLGDVGDELGIDGGAADCGAQKGFSVARTTLPGGLQVDVYNLHAEAGSGPEDRAARVDNFAQLADFIDEFSAGRAIILGGDTNLHTGSDPDRPPDADTWTRFRAATGLIDVCDRVDCGDDAGRIDKFAYRDGADVEVTPLARTVPADRFARSDGQSLSDHDPVVVRFGVSEPATRGADGSGGSGGDPASVAALPVTGASTPNLLVGLLAAGAGGVLAFRPPCSRRRSERRRRAR